jgi:cytochrome c553
MFPPRKLRHGALPSTASTFERWREMVVRALPAVLGAAVIFSMPCAAHLRQASAEETNGDQYFEASIRPILVRRCYECHSAEAGEPEGGLRLDSAGGWLHGGARGAALVPGDPAGSLLATAIRYEDVELQMPPEGRLPQREIDLLEAWIRRGAPAPSGAPSPTTDPVTAKFDLAARRSAHWAWQPVRRVAPPPVADDSWPRDPLDRFILSSLAEAGLVPAQAASPETWLRRVTFDLTGLPPTRRDVENFLADKAPDAAARVVDRLLASDAFGECWGQHWLDLVRYADSKGHEQDFDIPYAWRYRDYVIRALNANVPYDQFVREHLAGDLMDPPRIDLDTRTNQSIQGTGFWHLGEATHSPVDIRGDEADRLANSLDVFGKTFLGMTVACARCHDHKFDAISKEDYYALCGFLESSSFQLANVADPTRQREVANQLAELQATASRELFAAYVAMMNPRLEVFESELATAAFNRGTTATSNPPDRPTRLAIEVQVAQRDREHPLHSLVTSSVDGAAPIIESLSSSAPVATVCNYSIMHQAPLKHDDWLTSGLAFGAGPVAPGSILLKADKSQPIARVAEEGAAASWQLSSKLTGMFRTRTFEAPAEMVWYRYRGEAEVFADVDSHRTVAGPLHGVVKQSLKSPNAAAWFGHDLRPYAGHRVHVEFTPAGEFELYEVCVSPQQPQARDSNAGESKALIAPPPESVESAARAAAKAFHDSFEREMLFLEGGAPLAAADAQLLNWLLSHDDLLPPAAPSAAVQYAAQATQYVERRQQLEARIPEPEWALALLDGSGIDEPVHLRGNSRTRAKAPTPRGFLTALDGKIAVTCGSGRDQLADRLVDLANPLTARVFVNRVWSHLVGRGIVATVDNFGVLGEPPTHPDLLDYLTTEFVEQGWDVKQLIRRIVLSSVYAMSSAPDIRALDVDPQNKLCHAARVRRISAEAIRDSMLMVAGNLNSQRYGPAVPVHITEFMRHNRSPERNGPIDGDARRSIYLEVRRNSINHFLAAFDKPAPFTTVGNRYVSNSAAQPLALSNDPFVESQSQIWADALMNRFPDDDGAAVRDAYFAAFGRQESPLEAERLLAFLDAAQSGASQARRQQAWREICHTLFNVKEFVFLR